MPKKVPRHNLLCLKKFVTGGILVRHGQKSSILKCEKKTPKNIKKIHFLPIFFVYNANQIQNYCFLVLPLEINCKQCFFGIYVNTFKNLVFL